MPNPHLQDAAAIATTVSAFLALASALAAFATLAVLTVTAVYAGGQLKSAERSRQLSCLRDLSDKWSSELIREARRLVETGIATGLASSHADARYYKVLALANFFEDMGLLEKERQLTLKQVADRFKPSIIYYEERLRPFLAEQQGEDKTILANFTDLAVKLKGFNA